MGGGVWGRRGLGETWEEGFGGDRPGTSSKAVAMRVTRAAALLTGKKRLAPERVSGENGKRRAPERVVPRTERPMSPLRHTYADGLAHVRGTRCCYGPSGRCSTDYPWAVFSSLESTVATEKNNCSITRFVCLW